MLDGFVGGEAVFGVLDQQPLDEVLCVLGHILPLFPTHVEAVVHDFVHGLPEVGAAKRKFAQQHHMENHSETPHVALLVVAAEEHFGGGVLGGAALPSQGSFADDGAQAPVDDFDDPLVLLFQGQQVLGLDIPVGYTLRVRVVQRLQNLEGNLCGLLLREYILGGQLVDQLFPVEQLRYQIETVLHFVVFVELQNVRVVHLGQYFDLLASAVHIIRSVADYLQSSPQPECFVDHLVN